MARSALPPTTARTAQVAATGSPCHHPTVRPLIAVALLSLVLASTAQAKLTPTFSKRVAQPGDLVRLDVGSGSAQFLGPLRVYLVLLEAAAPLPRSSESAVKRESDPRLLKVGELGKPGKFGTPRALTFEAPDLPAGEYTAAIWFKGYRTGTWSNALEGGGPLLRIDAARSDDRSWLFWVVPLAAVGGLVAALVGLRWRRIGRPPQVANLS